MWCAPSASLALAYAAHAANKTLCDAQVCQTKLENRYLSTNIDELEAINSKLGGMSKAAFAEAERFQSQHSLFTWIQTQNDTKGVAPNTTMVLKFLSQKTVEPVATATQSNALIDKTVSVSWVQRFRRRWALKRGKFMPGERMTCDQIGQKVTLPNANAPPLLGANLPTLVFALVQKEGPPDGPQTGAM